MKISILIVIIGHIKLNFKSFMMDPNAAFFKTTEELQQENELKKAYLKELELLDKTTERKLQLKKLLFEEQLSLELLEESSKVYSEELMKIQVQYNSTIDPFNNIRKTSSMNRENYQKLAKAFSESSKEIEGLKHQHLQKVELVDAQIAKVQAQTEEMKAKLANSKEVLRAKRETLSQAREKRQSAMVDNSSVDFENLNQLMEASKRAQEQEKIELAEVCESKSQTEEAIRQLNDEFKVNRDRLESLHTELSEKIASNIVKEQRLAHEKKLFEERLQAKFDTHLERIHNGNINLARQVKEIWSENEKTKKKIEETNGKLVETGENIDWLAAETEKVTKNIENLDLQIANASNDNREFSDQKEKLMKNIEEMKKERQDMINEFEATIAGYNSKIKKQQRKQAMVGLVDDDKSSSDEKQNSVRSKVSSLTGGSQVKAEKMEIDLK